MIVERMLAPLILGMDWLKRAGAVLDLGKNRRVLGNGKAFEFKTSKGAPADIPVDLLASWSITVSLKHMAHVEAKAYTGKLIGEYIIASGGYDEDSPAKVQDIFTKVTDGAVWVTIANGGETPVTIAAGSFLAIAELAQEVEHVGSV